MFIDRKKMLSLRRSDMSLHAAPNGAERLLVFVAINIPLLRSEIW